MNFMQNPLAKNDGLFPGTNVAFPELIIPRIQINNVNGIKKGVATFYLRSLYSFHCKIRKIEIFTEYKGSFKTRCKVAYFKGEALILIRWMFPLTRIEHSYPFSIRYII